MKYLVFLVGFALGVVLPEQWPLRLVVALLVLLGVLQVVEWVMDQ